MQLEKREEQANNLTHLRENASFMKLQVLYEFLPHQYSVSNYQYYGTNFVKRTQSQVNLTKNIVYEAGDNMEEKKTRFRQEPRTWLHLLHTILIIFNY